MTHPPRTIASCFAILFTASSATAQTTFDHARATAITIPAGAVGGELLTEGFPGPPIVAITNAMIGLQPGDDIDALSFGDDVQISGFHQIIFSVDPTIPAFPVTGTGVDFENTVDTPLVSIPFAELCPGSAALEEIQQEWR